MNHMINLFSSKLSIECRFSNILSKYRTLFMGLAIVLVLIYHAFCVVYNPLGKANIGYVGVDIFLLLSGFGLTFSYMNNKLLFFYKNRLIRIYPLYFLCVCILYLLNDKWNFVDYLFNLLTVGFYLNNGVNRFDWYIESLFTLYILFPLLAEYAKLKLWGVLLLIFIICIILSVVNISWWYDCFISRIPIFIFGIVCAKYEISQKVFLIITLLGLLFYFPCSIFFSEFLAASFLVLPIIIIVAHLIQNVDKRIIELISFMGKRSLELYLANVFVLYVLKSYDLSVFNRALIYIPLQIIFSFILIVINNRIKRILDLKIK